MAENTGLARNSAERIAELLKCRNRPAVEAKWSPTDKKCFFNKIRNF